ncbi:cache domain-containing protein, partial [Pseudomonadota bacterium]
MQTNLEQVQRLSAQQAQRISEWLDSRKDIVNAMGDKANSNTLDALLQAKQSGRFESTYFGKASGEMIDSDQSIDFSDYDPRQRPWYQQANSEQQLIITTPYLDAFYNTLVVTLATPTINGVVAGDLSINDLVNDVKQMKLPSNGFAIMIHRDGTVIAYKDSSKTMGHIRAIDNDLDYSLLQQNRRANELMSIHFAPEDKDKLIWLEAIPNTDWELILVLDQATLEAPLKSLLLTQLGIAAIILLVSMVSISLMMSRLLAPLSKVSQALAHIAQGNGDLTQRIEIESKDEVGTLAENFNLFVHSQHQLITQIRQVAHELDQKADQSLGNSHEAAKELQVQQQEVTMVATAVTQMASAT